MRAVCESCSQPQPKDWQAGDRCVHCGLAVRAENRCYWCVTWQPAGKFCRHCGAEGIDPNAYGAARMLKHQGASVFEIPKLLREFEPDRVAVFQTMYQRHQAVANRHVDYVEWLEQFLYQKHWSEELDAELTQQLPWDEKRLRQMDVNAPVADRDRLHWLSTASPLPRIQCLAMLARLGAGDMTAYNEAAVLLGPSSDPVCVEAALQVTGWRPLYLVDDKVKSYIIVEHLRNHPLRAHAQPRLAWYGEPADLTETTNHEDTEFLRAIVEKREGTMRQALGDPSPEKRYVAAWTLVQMGRAAEIGPTLPNLPERYAIEILRSIRQRKKPVPDLHRALAGMGKGRVRTEVASVIALGATAETALELLRADPFDHEVIHRLMAGTLEPATLDEIARFLLFNGLFDPEAYGWSVAAKPGRLAEDFVERMFPHVDNERQERLIQLAEKQIGEQENKRSPLARFLVRTAFETPHPNVRAAAWWALRRNKLHNEFMQFSPFPLTVENVEWCWTVPDFLRHLLRLLRATKSNRDLREQVEAFLYTADEKFFARAATERETAREILAYLEHESGRVYATAFEVGLRDALGT